MKTILPALLLFCCLAVSAQNGALRYNLRQNEMFMLRFNSERQSVFNNDGERVMMTTIAEGLIRLKVVGEKRNSYEFEASYEKVSVKFISSITQKETGFGSTDSIGNDLNSRILKKIMGQPFLIKMSAEGEIKQITGLDAMIEKELAKTTYLPDSVLDRFRDQLVVYFGDDQLRTTLQPFTHIYPANLSTATNHWKTQSKVIKPNTFNIVMYFMIEEPTRLRINGSGELFIQSYETTHQGKTETTTLFGKVKSDIEIDVKTGWPLKTFLTTNMVGNKNLGIAPLVVITDRMSRKISYEVWQVKE